MALSTTQVRVNCVYIVFYTHIMIILTLSSPFTFYPITGVDSPGGTVIKAPGYRDNIKVSLLNQSHVCHCNHTLTDVSIKRSALSGIQHNIPRNL